MNYDEMSDLEINQLVTCLDNDLQGWELSESGLLFYHCGLDGDGWNDFHVIDYCNSPSDAWPIILKNNIVVTPCMGLLLGDATGYFESRNPITIDFKSDDKALRVAMICFLKMKDGEIVE